MIMHVPLEEWDMDGVFTRSLSSWTLNMKRWKDDMSHTDGKIKVTVYSKNEF